jgi:MYXO-CTERM domain-containing protein
MTHLAEADVGLERLRAEGVPGLADLAELAEADPVARLHLHLGSFLPDLREASEAIRFPTHSRAFAAWLLQEVARDASRPPRHRLLALGVVAHVCSDISAQLFGVPRFLASGRVGAPDVMVGLMDDRPDGEGELLVEAIVDIYYGDPETLLRLYDHFQPDPPAPERLDTALDWWLADAEAFFGPGQTGDPTAIKQEVHATLERVATELTSDRRDQLLGALDLARSYNLGDVLILVDGVGLLDEVVSHGYEVELDYGEIYRLQEVSPFFGNPDHFVAYPEDLAALGPRILVDSAMGAPWLEQWPTWRAAPLAGAAVESLAALPAVGFSPTGSPPAPEPGSPDIAQPRGEVGLYDLRWEDPDTGLAVTAVSTATPLGRVTLVVEVYPLTAGTPPAPRTLRIRKAVAGAPYLAGPVLASAPLALDAGAMTWAGAPPEVTRITLDLQASTRAALCHAEGLHAEIATFDGTPLLTTAWEPFTGALPEWRLERPVYAEQFSTYAHFPRSLPVVGDPIADDTPPGAPAVALSPNRLDRADTILTVTLSPGEAGGDPESGLTAYEVSVGTTAGGVDVVDASLVPAVGVDRRGTLTVSAPAALLERRGELNVTAHAINGAGSSGPPTHAGPVPVGPPGGGGGCGCGTRARSDPAVPGSLPLSLLALLIAWRRRRSAP